MILHVRGFPTLKLFLLQGADCLEDASRVWHLWLPRGPLRTAYQSYYRVVMRRRFFMNETLRRTGVQTQNADSIIGLHTGERNMVMEKI